MPLQNLVTFAEAQGRNKSMVASNSQGALSTALASHISRWPVRMPQASMELVATNLEDTVARSSAYAALMEQDIVD